MLPFYEKKINTVQKRDETHSDIKPELKAELIDKYLQLRKEINSMYTHLQRQEISPLNLVKMFDFFNLFGKVFLKEEEIKYASVSGLVTINTEDEKIPLMFKNKKKVILSKTNFDLSHFTSNELIEILRLLDVLICDNSYDHLRTEISKHLANISQVSIVKAN